MNIRSFLTFAGIVVVLYCVFWTATQTYPTAMNWGINIGERLDKE